LDVVQVFLVTFGALVAIGGLVLMLRSAGKGDDARRGYLPFAMIIVGLIVAYRSFSDFQTLDAQDITIMFLFAIALLTLIGLQFFVMERGGAYLDAPAKPESRKGEGEDANSG
jgi:membrane-bound ClpP family serine protease